MLVPRLWHRLSHWLGHLADGLDSGRGLDKMIAQAEAQTVIGTEPLAAAAKSLPRVPFENHVPFLETSFGHMTLVKARRLLSVMPGLRRQIARGAKFYRETFVPRRAEITPAELAELEALLRAGGAKEIGYVSNLDPNLIFQGKSLPHPHAIVFTVEMDRDQMETSPSFDSFLEVARGYSNLGQIAGDATDWLRARGFAAYPGASMGGITDYPAVAEAAGLGAIGYHGLLIGPSAGARVRVNTIYTNIANLPRPEDPHLWVRDFCDGCRHCVRSCPVGAIELEPQPKQNGYKRTIRAEDCRDYFARQWGCAVCLAVCPFSHAGYEAVKAGFDRARGRNASPLPLSTIAPRLNGTDAAFDGTRFAVIGAGPAGFYATKALLEAVPQARVDIFERLPFPHGLVRYGVAPDHPEVKSKGWTYDRILDDPRVRFQGGVELGRDLAVETLDQAYSATIVTIGARESRNLGIPGEARPGSFAAADFVRWYNGHPDFQTLPVRLGPRVAIIGHGNVALDAARMLLAGPARLGLSDMTPGAVETLATAGIRDVSIIGRSGPSETAFTPKEIVELEELGDVQIRVDPASLAADLAEPLADPQAERRRLRNLELFQTWAAQPRDPRKRAVHIRFCQEPVEILGDGAGVTGLRLAETEMKASPQGAKPERTGRTETLACDAVIRSIGFQAAAVPGLPFDPDRARLPVDARGRILGAEGPIPRLYASGWARRGPVGVIGTNKLDAEEVVETLVSDLRAAGPRPKAGFTISSATSREDWFRIQRAEKHRGAIRGKAALKFTSAGEAVAWADQQHVPTAPPAPQAEVTPV